MRRGRVGTFGLRDGTRLDNGFEVVALCGLRLTTELQWFIRDVIAADTLMF